MRKRNRKSFDAKDRFKMIVIAAILLVNLFVLLLVIACDLPDWLKFWLIFGR